ncbi:unnamed protein product [Moneuplotes crassus]|uniref:Uncharacterized protein n=1 Tax=Euplotes crassus TaxID=5936 RepID=A0AAD1UCF8_EUPCR|nr:unnamed protein product [Moneuplotes crassus]
MRIGFALIFATLLAFSVLGKRDISSNKFGSLEVTQEFDDIVEKEVFFSDDSLYFDDEVRSDFLMDSIDQAKVHMNTNLKETIYKCKDKDWGSKEEFQFLPVFVGSLMTDETVVEYEGTCFEKMTFTMKHNSDNSVKVSIDARKKKSTFCKEALFLSTTMRHHVEYLFLERTHHLTLKNLDDDDIIDLNLTGLKMYLFCDGVMDSFISVFNTAKLFLGGLGDNPKLPIIGSHVPEYMEKANVHFIKEAIGWDMQKRDVTYVDLDESEIHDGDYFAITRLDGLDEIIMWGTGGRTGHSTVALWIDGELHVIESQDAWYWPKHNIQRNTYKQWVEWARNCDFNVAILPLRDELRAKFNNTAALEFFETVEGMPYGYHNFLFSWIDTVDKNYPPVAPKELIPIVLDIFAQIMPATIDTFFTQAMNQRLGTSGLNYRQVIVEAALRNTTMLELMAQPELDGWMYSDGYSYVCSCFVVAIWKAAGIFGDLEINAVEFTPKDVYQLNVFNTTAAISEKCKSADPTLPYCQILGKYRMELNGYSSVDMYSHMNENCESEYPDYIRNDGC